MDIYIWIYMDMYANTMWYCTTGIFELEYQLYLHSRYDSSI